MTNLISFVEDMLLADYSVIPVKEDKRPYGEWQQYQSKPMATEEADRAFAQSWGVAVICGKVSGGLECIDFDAHDNNIHEVFKEWASEQGVIDIITRNKLYVEKSPRGGYHVLYRYDSDTYEGSMKLANWEDGSSMIETKGEKGYVIVSPSPKYVALRNTLESLNVISYDEREYLISHARNFNKFQKQQQQAKQQGDNREKAHEFTDPVSWFNWNKVAYAKHLMSEKGWAYVGTDATTGIEEWRRPGKTEGISGTWGRKENMFYCFTSSDKHFQQETYYSPFQVLVKLRFKSSHVAAYQWILSKYFDSSIPYIRVAADYFKKIKKTDRYGIWRTELKGWKKDEIKQDHGRDYLEQIPKFDDFTIHPNNREYMPVIENCYNLYKEFTHEPKVGSWKWSEVIMRHIFGDQYELGMRYLQALYLHPKRMLPILVLVSKERQTGKTTFLNWLNMIFGDNMVNIGPEDLTGSFNHLYATSNIIAIEETLIEKAITVEKLKSLATGKFISVNQKFISQYKVPFFGKIIMASNNEDKFARIDEEEVRFFVRKVGIPKEANHDIETNLMNEIPAFLHHLTTLPAIDWTKDRSGFTPEEIGNDSLNKVKIESKSGLYKELTHLFIDLFNNHPTGANEVMATPTDIKEKWFKLNSRVDIGYIVHVLKNEFKINPAEKVLRYLPFDLPNDQFGALAVKKVGTPYTFKFTDFVKERIGSDNNGFLPISVNENELPF